MEGPDRMFATWSGPSPSAIRRRASDLDHRGERRRGGRPRGAPRRRCASASSADDAGPRASAGATRWSAVYADHEGQPWSAARHRPEGRPSRRQLLQRLLVGSRTGRRAARSEGRQRLGVVGGPAAGRHRPAARRHRHRPAAGSRGRRARRRSAAATALTSVAAYPVSHHLAPVPVQRAQAAIASRSSASETGRPAARSASREADVAVDQVAFMTRSRPQPQLLHGLVLVGGVLGGRR